MSSTEFQARSSLSVTLSVWRALLLREALTRISGGRAPWVWLLLEPVFHMAFMVTALAVIRHRVVGGIDSAVWVMVGMLAYFMFRRPAMQGIEGISANRALFTYRQVRPIDTVMVRAALEGIVMVIVSLIVLCGAALLGMPVLPDDPLMVFGGFFGLWLLGLGFGMACSVPNELVPEFGHLLKFIMTPLYLLSGVLFPIALVPYPYLNWLMFNPVIHGVEAVRAGYANHYHPPADLSLGYLYAFALVLVLLGLALHVRFVQRLIAR